MDKLICESSFNDAVRIVYNQVMNMSSEEFEQRNEEIDVCRLILIAKNTGKGFNVRPDDMNFRRLFCEELSKHL